MGIRELTYDWSTLSYEEGCKRVERTSLNKDINEYIMKRLHHFLYELKRYKYMNMDGKSVEKLPKNPKAEKYEGIRFAEIISQMRKMEYEDFSPAKYLAQITKLCNDNNLDDEMTIGILARGMRSFASFLREIDVEEQLERILTDQHIPHELTRNTEMDVKNHTDIMAQVYDRFYRIWLFANSPEGIKNTNDRLRENRGELPDGIHILCPMNPKGKNRNTEKYEEINGWRFYHIVYIENIANHMIFPTRFPVCNYKTFISNMDLSKEEIQVFEK